MTDKTLDLDELEKKALAATEFSAGHWYLHINGDVVETCQGTPEFAVEDDGTVDMACPHTIISPYCEDDLINPFITAANPQTVITLISAARVLETVKAERDRLVGTLVSLDHQIKCTTAVVDDGTDVDQLLNRLCKTIDTALGETNE